MLVTRREASYPDGMNEAFSKKNDFASLHAISSILLRLTGREGQAATARGDRTSR